MKLDILLMELIPINNELEEMYEIQEKQHYNKKIKNRIENNYSILLRALKGPYNRHLIKAFMANLTSADLMTRIEGKKNKSSHSN